jgi:uncharacterized protein YecE (DUF72 family)
MKNIDCEIYISQLISFFENNPNDLIDLIGEIQKDEFYQKLRERCFKNIEEGEHHIITRKQMVDVVVDLKSPELYQMLNPENVIDGFIQKTKWGDIILN